MNDIKIKIDFYYGCKVDILGDPNKEYPEDDLYDIQFYNDDTGELIFETSLTPNHWTTPNIKYFTKWRVFVYKNGSMILNTVLSLKNKKVLIAMDTKPLGDNIAWLSHILEFSKKHQCEI